MVVDEGGIGGKLNQRRHVAIVHFGPVDLQNTRIVLLNGHGGRIKLKHVLLHYSFGNCVVLLFPLEVIPAIPYLYRLSYASFKVGRQYNSIPYPLVYPSAAITTSPHAPQY
jgi:hypothetical protein